jgi:hypothetical protein
MDELDLLLEKLQARGLTLSRDQAQAMAVRLAGSVTAYLAELQANDRAATDYQAPTTPADQVPEKFKDDLAYTVEKPADAA